MCSDKPLVRVKQNYIAIDPDEIDLYVGEFISIDKKCKKGFLSVNFKDSCLLRFLCNLSFLLINHYRIQRSTKPLNLHTLEGQEYCLH